VIVDRPLVEFSLRVQNCDDSFHQLDFFPIWHFFDIFENILIAAKPI